MTRLVAVAAALAVLVLSRPSQAAEPDVAALQALIDQAESAYDDGRYDDALGFYQAAFDGGGPPELVYLVGRCHQQMERWADARDSFRHYLALTDLDPEVVGRAEMALRTVQERLASGTLVIQVVPFGAVVTLDGAAVGTAPVDPLDLPPGPHELRVEAPGHEPAVREVVVEGGRRHPVAIELVALPGTETDAETDASPRRYSPWTWITLGTGAALVIGGTTSYLLGDADHGAVADADPSEMSQRRALALADSGDTKKTAGYVLWGLGGACLATSTVLFVLEASAPEPASAIQVGVAPAPGGGLLSIFGEF